MVAQRDIATDFVTGMASVGLGLAPPFAAQSAVRVLFSWFDSLHPNVVRLLDEFAPCTIDIVPTDAFFGLRITMTKHKAELGVLRPGDDPADSRIFGSVKALVGILCLGIDSDAAFFSREIWIEGNTTVVTALRYAIEREEIDISADLQRLPVLWLASARKVYASRVRRSMWPRKKRSG